MTTCKNHTRINPNFRRLSRNSYRKDDTRSKNTGPRYQQHVTPTHRQTKFPLEECDRFREYLSSTELLRIV